MTAPSIQTRVSVGVELTIKPTATQVASLSRHAGARRFAYNWCVGNQRELYARKKAGEDVAVPCTPFDNIDAFNKWKVSPAAGTDEQGEPGLPWRKEVCQQVFEEGAKDAGQAIKVALENLKERRQGLTKRKVGFPEFRSRFVCKPSFRLRNSDGKRFSVARHSVKIPGGLCRLQVREGTARLRRLLRIPSKGQPGKIVHVTISFREGYWRLSLNLEVERSVLAFAGSKAQQRQQRKKPVAALGCDVGLKTLLTVADAKGGNMQTFLSEEEIACKEQDIRKLQRRLANKREASKLQARAQAKSEGKKPGAVRRVVGSAEKRARQQLSRRFARQRRVRLAHMHAVTSSLIPLADSFGLENLNIAPMVKNHCLAGAIARQAWGEFRRQMTYKILWAGKTLVVADRFFPSSKRCSRCHETKSSLCLADRAYLCSVCDFSECRDVNAAANLAQYALAKRNAAPEVQGR